jgi:cysteinyl-tRNA synthetase
VWTELFKRDLTLMNVREPDVWARATEHIPEQLAMIRALEANGFTYLTQDGVYFDTARDPGYGELSRLKASAVHTRVSSDAGMGLRIDSAPPALVELARLYGVNELLQLA